MTTSPGAPWLDALESRVRDAVERLGDLAAENRRLASRVEELEDRLARAGEGGGEGGDAGAAAEAAAWRRERAEVERRVRQLVETLEALLSDRSEVD